MSVSTFSQLTLSILSTTAIANVPIFISEILKYNKFKLS